MLLRLADLKGQHQLRASCQGRSAAKDRPSPSLLNSFSIISESHMTDMLSVSSGLSFHFEVKMGVRLWRSFLPRTFARPHLHHPYNTSSPTQQASPNLFSSVALPALHNERKSRRPSPSTNRHSQSDGAFAPPGSHRRARPQCCNRADTRCSGDTFPPFVLHFLEDDPSKFDVYVLVL
jgi:hypothetical protein